MSDVGPPSVATIYGPMFIGMFFSTILYGITVVQIVIYFGRVKRDPPGMRYFVMYLFVAETVSTGLIFGMLYEPLLTKAGLPDVQISSPLLLRSDGPVTALIATAVQFFMAWRIKVVGQKTKNKGLKIMAFIICIPTLASLAGGIWLGIAVAQKPRFTEFSEFKGAPALWLVSAAVADILIAGTLVVFLVKQRSTCFEFTKKQINRILGLTVQTGTLTAVCALADAVLFLTIPDTTIFFIWDLSLSKLYSNSVLCSLNARGWNDANSDPKTMTSQLVLAPGNRPRINVQSIVCPSRPEDIELGTLPSSHSHGDHDGAKGYGNFSQGPAASLSGLAY